MKKGSRVQQHEEFSAMAQVCHRVLIHAEVFCSKVTWSWSPLRLNNSISEMKTLSSDEVYTFNLRVPLSWRLIISSQYYFWSVCQLLSVFIYLGYFQSGPSISSTRCYFPRVTTHADLSLLLTDSLEQLMQKVHQIFKCNKKKLTFITYFWQRLNKHHLAY